MNLLVAKTSLQTMPPKGMLELTAYEVVVLCLVAGVMLLVL